MKKQLHLIMPMGGAGTRFFDNGFDCPKPLLMLRGKPFFYWATESLYRRIPTSGLTFVVLHEHVVRFDIQNRILAFYPEARIVVLDHVLNGAVLTCLEGIQELSEDTPLLFNDCDHYFNSAAFERFCAGPMEEDGALLTFRSDKPCYSYLAYDEFGKVSRTVEKQVISHDAICGAYYFSSKRLFCDYAYRYLQDCAYREFFLSGVYNLMAQDGKHICGIPVDVHIPFGTPEEYRTADALLAELAL